MSPRGDRSRDDDNIDVSIRSGGPAILLTIACSFSPPIGLMYMLACLAATMNCRVGNGVVEGLAQPLQRDRS